MNRRRWVVLAALLVMAAVVPVIAGQSARGQSSGGFGNLNFDELITSTVQLVACENLRPSDGGGVDLAKFEQAARQGGRCAGGSGTIIRPDGTILTNSHVALDENQEEPLWILVLRTVDDRSRPQEAYFARAVLYSPMGPPRGFGNTDPHLDLAVIVPAYTLDGTPIQPGDLSMRPLPMGEPEAVSIGDELRNIGYPGIGGDLITITGGSVSGFAEDPYAPDLGSAGWIKTDATMAGGLSGGTTISEDGLLIGVPTQYGDSEERPLGEGGIMIPIGQLNYLRPIPEGYNLLAEAGLGEGLPEVVSGDDPSATAANQVIVTGSIVSADSGAPVAGAWFIVLKPGIPVAEFLGGNQEAVYSFATSGADGGFQMNDPVERGQAYGVVVIARGFVNMSEDNRVIAPEDAPAVVTLPPIQMAVHR